MWWQFPLAFYYVTLFFFYGFKIQVKVMCLGMQLKNPERIIIRGYNRDIFVYFLQIQMTFWHTPATILFKYLVFIFFFNILCKVSDQILNQIPKIIWTIIAVLFLYKSFSFYRFSEIQEQLIKSWPAHFWELNRDGGLGICSHKISATNRAGSAWGQRLWGQKPLTPWWSWAFIGKSHRHRHTQTYKHRI